MGTAAATADTMALADLLHSFIEQLDGSRDGKLFASRGLACSALFVLLDKLSCPERSESTTDSSPYPSLDSSMDSELDDQLALQRKAVDSLHKASAEILYLARMTEPHDISPIGFDALYCAAMTFQWLYHESGDENARICLEDSKRCLRGFGCRWQLGTEYCALERMQYDTVKITT